MAAKSNESFKIPPASKPRTKTEVERQIAEAVGVSRKDAGNVFSALHQMIAQDLRKNGTFTIPGLAKITVTKKAATKARPGVNPFTGEKITIKAKPARKVVKLRALKNLKDFVN